jgi:tRNA nucleotidyltransferase (CCA-adding enzyme)
VAAAEPAASVAQRAAAAGLELADWYVVGGAVRDALTADGAQTRELDLAVLGDGRPYARALAKALGGRVIAAHEFGTATVVVPAGLLGRGELVDDLLIDVAGTRCERYGAPGALPDVELVPDIGADLARRDFTVNAMAWPLDPDAEPRRLADPFDGRADLAAGRVRVLHDHSFIDDPTRIFRAARYAVRLGGAVEPDTLRLLHAAVTRGALATVSAQRRTNELLLAVGERRASAVLALLDGWGVLSALGIAPRLAARVHELLAQLDGQVGSERERPVPGEPAPPAGTSYATVATLRLALLVAASGADEPPLQLEIPGANARAVSGLARLILLLRDEKLLGRQAPTELPASVHVLRALRDAPAELVALLAESGIAPVAAAFGRERERLTLSVDGNDLQALGAVPGPQLGAVLEQLGERKLAGELPSREDELAAARDLLGGRAMGET